MRGNCTRLPKKAPSLAMQHKSRPPKRGARAASTAYSQHLLLHRQSGSPCDATRIPPCPWHPASCWETPLSPARRPCPLSTSFLHHIGRLGRAARRCSGKGHHQTCIRETTPTILFSKAHRLAPTLNAKTRRGLQRHSGSRFPSFSIPLLVKWKYH